MTSEAVHMPGNTPARGWHPLLRWFPVWRRNLLFWRRLAWASAVSHLGEPALYMLVLGFGLGALVGEVEGMPYLHFLAAGYICSSVMMTATFEATYSAYTRMAEQRTWDAMLATPLEVRDIVTGEVAWAATKAMFSAVGVMIVAGVVGALSAGGISVLLILPVALGCGFTFSALGMLVTTLARSYDVFLFYTSLLITPMFLLSGVFFPLSQKPDAVRILAYALPLTHAVAVIRPLATGTPAPSAWIHLLVLAIYAGVALGLAIVVARKRLRA